MTPYLKYKYKTQIIKMVIYEYRQVDILMSIFSINVISFKIKKIYKYWE